jgi:hypothetical protein
MRGITVMTGKEPYTLQVIDSERDLKSSVLDQENSQASPLRGDEETLQLHAIEKGKMSSINDKENGSKRSKKFQLPDEFIVKGPSVSHKSARGIVAMRGSKQPGGGSKQTIDINNESSLTGVGRMKLEDSTRGIFLYWFGYKFFRI